MAAEKQFERSAYDSYLRKLSEEEGSFRRSFRTAFFQAMHEELTGRQYEVLWMGEVEGMTGKEIAARLGITPSAVSRHKTRGRKRLRTLLQYNLDMPRHIL